MWGLFLFGIVGFAIVVIAFLNEQQAEVAAEREKAAEITHERIQEDLTARYEGVPTSISQASVRSVWGETTTITGVMVRCDDGTTRTAEVSPPIEIPAGAEVDLAAVGLTPTMESLAGGC